MTGIRVADLTYSYGAKMALDGVSFDVAPGAFCALLGPNGAGKSTLFNLLTRLFVAPRGRIEIAGHDLARAPRAALAKLGIVFQQPTLDLDLTVRQNLSYFAALHGLSGRNRAQRIDQVLERLHIADRAREKARTLNGGHRRRTEIARALLHDPAVLLLDEPTVGLDAASRAAITDHVHGLADDGTTILWATHLADEVRPDDRLVILHRAKVLADGLAHDVSGDTSLQEAFLAMTSEAA
ncbi:ABC transporter ATP-binding protein [Cognatiyoonia sp. IB215446]|uniref:ABC transporter ATP-binding protein n=1 Tax=Cognatiyoonia sp. IB215446 TaxID=3097355 RepID=UPI002A0BD132|nr:ABC transporter ATP-binding protein [Cognatiyoonia sp. IB215446]MDX8348933.1 ABC transporter ATP-binding protein [Cognatiyoonia sp. IB215446]